MKTILELEIKNPDIVKKSLLPDIEKSKDIKIKIKTKKNLIIIGIETKKISHLKATINSYLSLINVLKKLE